MIIYLVMVIIVYFLMLKFGVFARINPYSVLAYHDNALTLDERAFAKQLLLGVFIRLLGNVI